MQLETWLSLDLSSSTGTVAVHRLNSGRLELLKEVIVGEEFRHSEKLIGVLENLLGHLGLPISRIDRFIAPSGPGSFTGLRIAFATLKAFALANPRPIETFSGSEARARAWAATQPRPLPLDQLLVFTHASMDRFVKAIFTIEDDQSLQFKNESLSTGLGLVLRGVDDGKTVCLLDNRTPISTVPVDASVSAENFPLRARYLAESLLTATSRKTYSSLEGWVELSPQYFGDTRF